MQLLTVESVDTLLTFVAHNTPIDAFIAVLMEREKILQYVQHPRHLYMMCIHCLTVFA